ncbi:MAG: ATP-binding protein [Myxococcota bacterium]|nr:ATP-binding protein [Myxococcota bacterium]
MPRIQIKIMSVLVGLAIGIVSLTGIFAERGLRSEIAQDAIRSLTEQARLVRQLTQNTPFEPSDFQPLQRIATEASFSTGARITLISSSGVVLADSGVPSERVSELDNHAARPEVAAALSGIPSHRIRWSQTLRSELLYVALPADSTQGDLPPRGVVRLAVRLTQIDQAVSQLRSELWTAAAIGLAVAIGLSYLLSSLSLKPIRELAEVVQDIADGRTERALTWENRDERGEIARSINRMAQHERNRLLQAEQEKGQLEAVLTSMAEGVLVLDSENKVLLANPPLREVLSLWGDVIGRPVEEIMRIPEITGTLAEVRQSGETQFKEIRLTKPLERVLLVHFVAFPREESNKGTVLVFHDVTETHRVDEIRRDFIANASHELRTPLTAIQGFADTLASSQELAPDKKQGYLDVIARNAQRMSNLIDDLMALSRIESGKEHFSPISLDVGRLIAMLMDDFRPQFVRAEIEARFHNTAEPSLIRADPSAVEQILTNLLTNAARYTDPGGTVDVRVETASEKVLISVSDTGIGIPDTDLERVFERFYRVDKSRSRALGSTGLGLAIVRHLVSAMDGDIKLESRVGRGTRVTVSLPKVEIEA